MYLSKVVLKRSNISIDLIRNPYRLHQRLRFCANGEQRVLFRIESTYPQITILIQSKERPDWTQFQDKFMLVSSDVKSYNRFPQEGLYRFRILANPSKQSDEHGRIGILEPDGQVEWLKRKLMENGAVLRDVSIVFAKPYKPYKGFTQNQKGYMVIYGVMFEGFLQVTDTKLFQQALDNGIGRGKGLGFGLLSVIPVDTTSF